MWQSLRGKLSAVEIAVDARVLTEEDLLVHLFEVEREVERPAYARVLELLAAGIEGERLHDPAVALEKFLEDDALVLDGGELVGGRPVLGAVLRAPVDVIGLEGLDGDRGVAEILVAQFVEVVAPDIDVEILRPVVLHALVDDGAPRHEFLDAVGAIAQRRLERGSADIALLARRVAPFPPMLRQD